MKIPESAINCSNYKALDGFANAFSRSELNLLMIVGRAGTSKSETVKGLVGPNCCWLSGGNQSPFGMYCSLYEHRDSLVVIDDVDSIYGDRNSVRLLKCLCQTNAKKTISWNTQAADRDGLPREFETSSKVCIISNSWGNLTEDGLALVDRGHFLLFEPTAQEIHRKVGGWFRDAEIYKWFGENLHLFPKLSMRNYTRAKELKSAGLNWFDTALSHVPKHERILLQGLRDPTLKSEKERVEVFISRTGKSRACYFGTKKRLAPV